MSEQSEYYKSIGYCEGGYCRECANSGGDHHPNCSMRPGWKGNAERTLEQSLARAASLRDFKAKSPKGFARSDDFQDVVNLADEIERMCPVVEAAIGWRQDHIQHGRFDSNPQFPVGALEVAIDNLLAARNSDTPET